MKKLNKNLIVISACMVLITIFSCKKQENTETVIKGTLSGLENKKVVLKSIDTYNSSIDTITLDDKADFTFKVKIEKPKYYTLSTPNALITLYVKPNDSIILNAKSEDVMKTITFSGKSAVYNDYLIKQSKISNDFESNRATILSKEEKYAVKSMDSLLDLHNADLENLKKGFANIDEYFVNTEKSKNLYEWGILHCFYPQYYNYINGKELKTSPEYDNYVAELNINDEKLTDLPIYTKFIASYISSKYNDYENDSIQKIYSSYTNYQLKGVDNIIKNEKVKSLIAYNIVEDQIRYDGLKDYDSYYKTFETICSDTLLKSKVTTSLKDWGHLKKGKQAQDFSFRNVDGEMISLSSFKGHWVYIDVWATWCNPCMHELPTLKKIEENLHNKNIVFISICVDKTPEPWLKTVAEKELKGVQLWSGRSDILKGFYKISAIPRFMIIDPEGKIYESSATRPTMGAEKILLDLMNK